MGTTIRARYTNGVLKPLENVDLEEGEEVSVIIATNSKELTAEEARARFEGSAGGWVGLIDCEKLKRDIYESRSIVNPRKVEL